MMQSPLSDGVLQRLDGILLTDDLAEALRPPAAVECLLNPFNHWIYRPFPRGCALKEGHQRLTPRSGAGQPRAQMAEGDLVKSIPC